MSEKTNNKTQKTTTLQVVVIEHSDSRRIHCERRTSPLTRFAGTETNQMLGTNIPQNLSIYNNLQNILGNFNSYNIVTASDFIRLIGENLQKNKGASKYQTFEVNGKIVVLRLSDHNANCNNFINEIDKAFSIVIKSPNNRKSTFISCDRITATEYIYFEKNSNAERYCNILRGILGIAENGEYTDYAQAEYKNVSEKKTNQNGLGDTFANNDVVVISDLSELDKFANSTNKVPDWSNDTPQAARERGFRKVDGVEYRRANYISSVYNYQLSDTSVVFDENKIKIGCFYIVSANELIPSHKNGQRNPRYFLDEAQPKNRIDQASVLAYQNIAKNLRPQEVIQGITAYLGTPIINQRGEVIQGNNRTAALQYMYSCGTAHESTEKYFNALINFIKADDENGKASSYTLVSKTYNLLHCFSDDIDNTERIIDPILVCEFAKIIFIY